MVVVQLLSKGLISGFWKHRLFLKDGQDTHGLKDLNENIELVNEKTITNMVQHSDFEKIAA
jgi:hypothetical protein